MTSWSHHSELVNKKVVVNLEDAPRVKYGKIEVAPTQACWQHVNGEITVVFIEGRIVKGPESRSGGSVILHYVVRDQPEWLAEIMEEAHA